jgi:hypothetical protein
MWTLRRHARCVFEAANPTLYVKGYPLGAGDRRRTYTIVHLADIPVQELLRSPLYV